MSDDVGGLPLKRYGGRLYAAEPFPPFCWFTKSFIQEWENTKEFQVGPDGEWVYVKAENAYGRYRRNEPMSDAARDMAVYRLYEASWSRPPPMAGYDDGDQLQLGAL